MHQDAPIRWKAYPALLLAGSLAVGIAAAAHLGLGFWAWGSAAAAGLVLAMGAIVFPRRRRLVTIVSLLWTLVLGGTVACAGGALYAAQRRLPPAHVAYRVPPSLPGLAPPQVTLYGIILNAPETPAYGVRFTLGTHRLVTVRDTFDVAGKVLVTLLRSRWSSEDDPFSPPALAQGDRVRVTGALEPAPRPRNPADFDYGAHLRRRGIHVTLSTYDSGATVVLGRATGWADRLVVQVRRYIERQIRRHVPSHEARAVLRALLLGDRSRITEGTRERFVRTGLMHLLAVSGLHVLLVGMVLYGLLRPLFLRLGIGWRAAEYARTTLTLVLLILYALVTGARPPVVRAVVMAGIFMGGILLQRRTHTLNMLGVAALLLLALQPSQLFDVGFQLSFAAVGAIVVFNPVMRGVLPHAWWERNVIRWIANSLTATGAAVLGTAPLLLYHFGRLSLAGLLLNLPAIPCTGAVLSAAIALVLAGGWATPLAACFGAAADVFARMLLELTELGDAWLGWAVMDGYLRDPFWLLTLVVLLLVIVQWRRPRLRWRLCVTALLVASLSLWSFSFSSRLSFLDVIFFDVGQGDAALVTLPNGEYVLIDTGPRTPFSSAAERTLLPHLRRYGIDRLDAVIVSHSDRDHLGGLPALLRAVPVERVIHGVDSTATDLYTEVQHVVDSLGIPSQLVRGGDTLRLAPSVTVRVLAPFPGPVRSDNEASLVLHLTYGTESVLFMGDAERATEERLVTYYGSLLDADVIKVSHHGSSTSSTPAFVRHAAPDRNGTRPYAVVSVGRNNSFGLPDPRVLQRWKEHGASVLVTARVGAVWLRSDGRRFWPMQWR